MVKENLRHYDKENIYCIYRAFDDLKKYFCLKISNTHLIKISKNYALH